MNRSGTKRISTCPIRLESQSKTDTVMLPGANTELDLVICAVSGEALMPVFGPITNPMKSRGRDRFGSGQYGVSRDGGARRHLGLDIVVAPGNFVLSPIDGTVIHESIPYASDTRFRGIHIVGQGDFSDYEVKIFYCTGLRCGYFKKGDEVARVQDLSIKYEGITNHVHMEVFVKRQHVNPFDAYQMSF